MKAHRQSQNQIVAEGLSEIEPYLPYPSERIPNLVRQAASMYTIGYVPEKRVGYRGLGTA